MSVIHIAIHQRIVIYSIETAADYLVGRVGTKQDTLPARYV